MFDTQQPLQSELDYRTDRVRNGVGRQRRRTSLRLARALHLGPPRGEVS